MHRLTHQKHVPFHHRLHAARGSERSLDRLPHSGVGSAPGGQRHRDNARADIVLDDARALRPAANPSPAVPTAPARLGKLTSNPQSLALYPRCASSEPMKPTTCQGRRSEVFWGHVRTANENTSFCPWTEMHCVRGHVQPLRDATQEGLFREPPKLTTPGRIAVGEHSSPGVLPSPSPGRRSRMWQPGRRATAPFGGA